MRFWNRNLVQLVRPFLDPENKFEPWNRVSESANTVLTPRSTVIVTESYVLLHNGRYVLNELLFFLKSLSFSLHVCDAVSGMSLSDLSTVSLNESDYPQIQSLIYNRGYRNETHFLQYVGWNVNLFTRLHFDSKLRMRGAMTLLLLYVWRSWTRTNLPWLSRGKVSEWRKKLSGYCYGRMIRTMNFGGLNKPIAGPSGRTV
jgi:hypothetical protein